VDEIGVEELAARLGEMPVLDVRGEAEFTGAAGYPCDARQGHIPGARHVDLSRLLDADGAEAVRDLVGEPEGVEVVAYCHSGSRSQLAAQILAAAGYRARNYRGSWHEWSSLEGLPAEA
jgi:thiosulfate/3-mercaptopyruvate sulfurtransferase